MKHKISTMGNEHTAWLSALDFYKQEFGTLSSRLTEIAGKNTGAEVAAQIEHFQNQFSIQLEKIDVLRHNINTTLSLSASEVKANAAGYIDDELIEGHNKESEDFDALESTIKELRAEFSVFAAKWM